MPGRQGHVAVHGGIDSNGRYNGGLVSTPRLCRPSGRREEHHGFPLYRRPAVDPVHRPRFRTEADCSRGRRIRRQGRISAREYPGNGPAGPDGHRGAGSLRWRGHGPGFLRVGHGRDRRGRRRHVHDHVGEQFPVLQRHPEERHRRAEAEVRARHRLGRRPSAPMRSPSRSPVRTPRTCTPAR